MHTCHWLYTLKFPTSNKITGVCNGQGITNGTGRNPGASNIPVDFFLYA